ncbi:MAG: hypothetical protein ACLULH_09045 [Bacteroides fragilis]
MEGSFGTQGRDTMALLKRHPRQGRELTENPVHIFFGITRRRNVVVQLVRREVNEIAAGCLLFEVRERRPLPLEY